MRSPLAIAKEKLSARIFLSFGLLFLVVVFFFAGFYLFDRWQLAREAFMREGTSLARVLAFNARIGVVTHNQGFIKGALDGVTSYEGVVSAGVYSPEGKPILEERGALDNASPPRPLPPEAKGALKMSPGPIRFETATSVEFWAPIILEAGSFSEEELYFGASSQDIHERTIGFARVIFDKGSVTNAFRFLVVNSVLIALAAIILWGILAYVIGRKVTRPLDRLTDGVRALRDGDFRKVDVVTSDEVGRLAGAFNGMVTALEQREAERSKAQEAISALNNELEQRVIRRTAELEKANREMESFNYSVSHDLRAPLRHINSFSAIVMEEFSNELPAPVKDYLVRIRSASNRMGGLIDHLLELSRVGRAALKLEPVDLSMMAASILTALQETELKRTVKIFVEEDVRVLGDRTLLQQLLENLLGNAWKYTSKTVTAHIEFGSSKRGDSTIFYVKDNGAGFDMQYKDNLFIAFQRLHTAEFEGEGIGLTTAQRIIHRHSGDIWAEGEVGKGATFYFTLPN
ncbi:MAG TPA: sensor histidine kinase [Geobacter sulfurreducens]|nr:sensor histidine kinase [Geobacter sulfurreducens]